jgi:poly(A) polymerase Pap1
MEAVKSAVLDDDKSYIIEKIINHEIVEINKRKVLNLTIKWHGYKEPEITGMNVSLQRNVAVQEYLKEKGLQSFGLSTKRSNIDNNENTQKIKRVKFSSSIPDDK